MDGDLVKPPTLLKHSNSQPQVKNETIERKLKNKRLLEN